jgi:hypothetical protein
LPGRRDRRRHRVSPGVEELGNRLLPAVTFTVDTAADTSCFNPSLRDAKDDNGHISLRSAIEQGNWLRTAQQNPETAITINVPRAMDLMGYIYLNSALPALDNNFTIVGPGAADQRVERSLMAINSFGIFEIKPNRSCSIEGLRISGGNGTSGGITNWSSLSLDSCAVVYNHSASAGGGVTNYGTLTVCACYVGSNTADRDGGGFYNAGAATLIISASEIEGNVSHTFGGGIFTGAESILEIGDGTTIIDNTAYQRGGGIYVLNPDEFTMTGGAIHYNHVTGAGENMESMGGGIYFNNVGGTAVTLTEVDITSNNASKGGGWYIDANSAPTFDTCTLSNNHAAQLGDGGAWQTGGDWTPINCTFTDAIDQDP